MRVDRTLLKILPRERLAEVASELHQKGEQIVFTNGCFDVIHAGHARYLRNAKAIGDYLIVGINTDDSVRKLKGENRPIMQEQDRAELIASLECVDYVTLFGEDTPVEIIRLIKPNIHVKGGDYKGKTLPEEAAVNENGGKVVIVPLVEGRSTTNVIDRIAELNGKEE